MWNALKLKPENKSTRPLAIATLALIQAATLTACGQKRAMLAKKPTTQTAPNTGAPAPAAPGINEQDSKKTPPKGDAPTASAGTGAGSNPTTSNPAPAPAAGAGTPAPTAGTGASAGTTTPTPPKSETPAAAGAPTRAQPAAPATPAASQFAQSLQWVTLQVLGNSVSVSFGIGSAEATEAHARLTGPLSGVTSKDGASLTAEPNAAGKPTAHVACEDATCSKATIKIGHEKGSATAKLSLSSPKSAKPVKVDNLAGLQANIFGVLESKDAKHNLVISEVVEGPTLFALKSVVAASTAGANREAVISGKISEKSSPITIAHVDSSAGARGTESDKLEGKASRGKDGSVTIEFDETTNKNDRIQKITLGDF